MVLVLFGGKLSLCTRHLCDQLARSDRRVNFAKVHRTGRHTPIPGRVCERHTPFSPRRATSSACRILALRNLVEMLQSGLPVNGLVHPCFGPQAPRSERSAVNVFERYVAANFTHPALVISIEASRGPIDVEVSPGSRVLVENDLAGPPHIHELFALLTWKHSFKRFPVWQIDCDDPFHIAPDLTRR